jgi:hypothetical protein
MDRLRPTVQGEAASLRSAGQVSSCLPLIQKPKLSRFWLNCFVSLIIGNHALQVRLNADAGIDVEKPSYHHLSQTEIASDNPSVLDSYLLRRRTRG